MLKFLKVYNAIDKTFKANNFANDDFVETVSVGTDKLYRNIFSDVLTWVIIVQYCDTDTVRLCQYNIFLVIKVLTCLLVNCQCSKYYLKVSLV